MEIQWLTLSEAANLIQKKELSPLAVTRTYADRIQALDPLLNCNQARSVSSGTKNNFAHLSLKKFLEEEFIT